MFLVSYQLLHLIFLLLLLHIQNYRYAEQCQPTRDVESFRFHEANSFLFVLCGMHGTFSPCIINPQSLIRFVSFQAGYHLNDEYTKEEKTFPGSYSSVSNEHRERYALRRLFVHIPIHKIKIHTSSSRPNRALIHHSHSVFTHSICTRIDS